MKRLLTAALIASLAVPAFAGGPVVIEDTEIEAVAPASSQNLLIPILLVAVVLAIASSGDEECTGRGCPD